VAYLAGISFHDLIFYGFTDNFGNGSPTDHSFVWKMEHFSENFINSEFVLLYPGMIAYFFIVRRIDWLSLWLIIEFAGINIVAMYDKAHLKDMLPALALSNALALAWYVEKYRLPVKQLSIILWIVFFPKLTEPLLSFKKLVSGETNTGEHYCLPPDSELENYFKKKLGRWIRDNTQEYDKVLVAGDGAEVQVYTERVLPSIYFNATETGSARLKFISDVQANIPALIAVPLSAAYQRDSGPEVRKFIEELINQQYYLDRCIYGYNIYRLISKHAL